MTYDTASNTVYVQASRADMEDAAALIQDWDTSESSAINDVRIFPLRNADAAGLAQVLVNALSVHVVNPLQQATFAGPVAPTAGGTSGLVGTGLPGGGPLGGGPLGGGPGGWWCLWVVVLWVVVRVLVQRGRPRTCRLHPLLQQLGQQGVAVW